MNYPAASESTGKSQSQSPKLKTQLQHASLSQSREIGEVIPGSDSEDGSVKARNSHARPWAHFVAGATGGLTSATLTSPLDVLKTRLQSDFYQAQIIAARKANGTPSPSSLPFHRSAILHFRETFQILFSIHRVEGWRALFKGLGPQLVGVVPARAINFFAYGNGKRLIGEKLNDGRDAAWVHLLAAANAGIITGTATNPIWLVKTRVQLDKNLAEKSGTLSERQYKNSMDCIRQTFRAEGIKGFYKGLTASYLGVAESTMQWVLYEQMKASLAARESRLVASGRDATLWDETVRWTGKIGAAGTAKFFAALITYPHEVLRTRLRQAPQADGRLKYTGIIQCFSLMIKEEGVVSLYGGLTPHMLRVVPSAAIMFGVYELVLKALDTPA